MATIFIIVAIWFFMKIDWCIGRDGITFYLLSNLQSLLGRTKALPYDFINFLFIKFAISHGRSKPLPYEGRVAEGNTSYAKRASRRQALHGTKSCFVSTKSIALPYNHPINCFGIREPSLIWGRGTTTRRVVFPTAGRNTILRQRRKYRFRLRSENDVALRQMMLCFA